MAALAIDINDASLVVANDSAVLAVEPGFARVDRGKILTGDAAKAGARLQPRQTSNRFWNALSMEPGSAGADIGKSAAELAYAQLQSLWRKVGEGVTDVVLVVPGAARTDQLGVLLGLAHECGMPVRALVDAAAAASVRPYPGKQLVYIDAGLHRSAVTLVDQNGEAHVRADHVLNQGLSGLADTFARRIADLFVRATRFDPFAHAEAEQLLYDRLPQWLEKLPQGERLELQLEYRNEQIKVPADRDTVLGAAHGFYRALRQLIAQHRERGKSLVVQVSDRLAALPGFLTELARLDDAEIESFELGHAARSVLLARSLVASQSAQVKFVKRLPWRAEPRAAAPLPRPTASVSTTTTTATAQPPTHLVFAGFAYRVGADGVVIGREQDPERRTVVLGEGSSGVSRVHCEVVLRDGDLRLRDLSSFGTFVNERKIEGDVTLQRGDVIRIGSPGAELHVVNVEGVE
jgi:hypothetical protein